MNTPQIRVDPDHLITVPVSLRLPGDLAIALFTYAEQMNTSAAKVVTSILEDAFQAFKNADEGAEVRIRIAVVYQAMVKADVAQAVNVKDLRERVMKRAEPGGTMGRPPKRLKRND